MAAKLSPRIKPTAHDAKALKIPALLKYMRFCWVPATMATMDILLGIFVSTIIGFVCLNQYFKRYRGRPNLPPGSLGLPVIGETLSFYRALRSNRLFEDFFGKRVQKHGKVFKSGLMGSPTVVFTGAVGNRFLMANEFKLVVSSWPKSTIDLMGSGSIMEKQGSEHRCLRGVVMACFRGALSETFVGKMSSVMERHFASHWKGWLMQLQRSKSKSVTRHPRQRTYGKWQGNPARMGLLIDSKLRSV